MRGFALGVLGAAALTAGSGANATTVIDFTSPAGNTVGTTHTYTDTSGTLSVIAKGYASNGGSLTNLYGKDLGGDEVGLGLNADPSGQHEIYRGAFVQLDVTDLIGAVTSAIFHFGSDTLNEQWEVYGSNTDGTLGTALLYGINDEGNHDLLSLAGWGTFKYYDFRSLGTGTHGFDGSIAGNVLLGNLVLTPTVPEPGTWALMLIGFGAVGWQLRRRGKPVLAQAV